MVVNRVLRDDSDKSSMHNREPITPKLLWQSLQDYQWSLVLGPPRTASFAHGGVVPLM